MLLYYILLYCLAFSTVPQGVNTFAVNSNDNNSNVLGPSTASRHNGDI